MKICQLKHLVHHLKLPFQFQNSCFIFLLINHKTSVILFITNSATIKTRPTITELINLIVQITAVNLAAEIAMEASTVN